MISQYFIPKPSLAVALFVSFALALLGFNRVSAREAKPVVVFTSECSCEGNHGESRWKAKTDALDPSDISIIRAITPSEMYNWAGPGVRITRKQDRIELENSWYAMTGRIVEIRAEEDGDLHVVLADAAGERPGKIIAEIPLERKWCSMRTSVFFWTNTIFPFTTRRGSLLNLVRPHVVTVIGRAFYSSTLRLHRSKMLFFLRTSIGLTGGAISRAFSRVGLGKSIENC